MGFFDKLKDVWTDWGADWKAIGDNFKSAGKSAWNGLTSTWAGTLNLTMAPLSDDLSVRAAIDDYRKAVSGGIGSVGGVGSALSGIPVVKQAFGTADWAQTELVKRPASTYFLMEADAFNEGFDPFFDTERWKKAYNSTTYVTPGQAWFMWATARADAAVPDDIEKRDILRDRPYLGLIAPPGLTLSTSFDAADVDPRDRQKRQQYYDNPWMKTMSGTLDAGVAIFADPTVVLGKLAWLGKAKWWSKEMTASAIASGKHLDFQDSNAYAKTKEYIKSAPDAATVETTVFNNKFNGSTAANLLWSVAKDQKRYEELGGQHDLYDLTWRALYGDEAAWETLAKDAPRIADVVGTRFANYTLGQVGKEYGSGDPLIDAQWDAARETRTQAWVDAMANGHGLFGRLGEGVKAGGLMTGQAVPRLRTSSKWRVGVHQWMRNAPPTVLGNWARRANYVLPSSRTGRMLDVNDINGARYLRANLEHSRLSQEEINYWVSAYGRASSPESRFLIYNSAENAAFRAHAKRYGLSAKQLDRLIPEMNRWRSGARQVLSSSRRFMSADVRTLAKAKIDAGRQAEGDELNAMADDIEDAVKRGDMPPYVYAIPDEDGNLSLIPEDTDISSTAPVLISQHADVVPMVDWNVLENALWWNTKGGFGKAVFGAIDGTRAALDSMMSVWKVSAILRPGYVWRALSDEAGRAWATLGSSHAFMGVTGAANSLYNWSSRGRLVGEIIGSAVTGRKATGQTTIDVDADVDDVAKPMPTRVARNAEFGGAGPVVRKGTTVYRSYEEAFADGVIGVDDLVERVTSHGQAGTLSPRFGDIYNARHVAGTLSETSYRRAVTAEALRVVGRAAYAEPAWQQALIDAITAGRKNKKPGDVGAGLVVDPFTGASPRVRSTQLGDKFSMTETRLIGQGTDGFEPDDVHDFIVDHLDELTKPGSLLAGFQRADGVISLSVARATPETAAKLAIKPGGGKRIKAPFSKREGRAYRDSGSAGWNINTPAGPVYVQGAFEGQHGDLLRAQTSSRGVDDMWTETITNVEYARAMAKAGRWVDVTNERPEYPESWERAVNLQLANDPVARQFLAGRSIDDVIAWMHNTSEGRAYNYRMGPWRSRYAEQVQIVQSMTELYAPMVMDRLEESEHLRKRIVAGNAKFEDFEAVMSRDNMPKVHGASIEYATGSGPWMDRVRKLTDRTFKMLSDMPSDKLVRHPFAAERYRLYASELVKARGDELAKRGNTLSTDDVEAIEKQARSRALMDVQKYLYESAVSLDLAKAFRLLVPFGSAIGDSTTKWGVVLRENPWVALNLWKVWTAPERNGLVQDEDGNRLRVVDGKEVWYAVNPKTGEETRLDGHEATKRLITFRLPSWLGPNYANGVQPTARIDKDVFRTFLDMPTFGPIVSVPANEFSLSHPEFSENRFVRTFVLPYGPSADWKKAGVPGNVTNVATAGAMTWRQITGGEQSEEFQSTAQTIFMTEMTRHSLGQREKPPTFEEARTRAFNMLGLRALYRFGGVSGQFMTPFQPYVDYYHTLRVQDPENADERFYTEMGEEYFALTAAVTRNSMGLPATVGAFNQYRKLRDLMDQHPELSALIAGEEGAGEFSRAVYESQKQTPIRFGSKGMMRERLSPEESWAEVQRRKGWLEYGRFMDAVHADMARLGVTSLEVKRAKKLKAAKQRWLQARMMIDSPYGGTVVNPWYQDFAQFDTSKMSARLNSLRQIVQDRRLQGRDDIRGLVDYLDLRGRFKHAMTVRGFKTLDSKKARALARQWNATVFQLKNRNLSFAALHDRWLSNDEYLEAV